VDVPGVEVPSIKQPAGSSRICFVWSFPWYERAIFPRPRSPFFRAQAPTSCPGVVILAVAFPGRHLDQRRSRKPAVCASGKLQGDTGTIIALRIPLPPIPILHSVT
jgi:hypothetical protein